MAQALIVSTSSGGAQVEVPLLGIQVLAMREIVEEPEAMEAGTVMLASTTI